LSPDERTRVEHMIEAAETVGRFVSGRSRNDLDGDEMLVFALVRAIEIIGEAASRISSETQQAFSDIPWRLIIAMRNRLVHAYFDVDRQIVWKCATEEVPELLPKLRNLLEP
jgi:uncharacterized protein with HEPN domain